MGFTGKEGDEEVGVVYFGERYLIARVGRWASPDPLHVHAVGGGEALNSYHYVAGNLLHARDPLGLDCEYGACESGESGAFGGTTADGQAYAGYVNEAAGTMTFKDLGPNPPPPPRSGTRAFAESFADQNVGTVVAGGTLQGSQVQVRRAQAAIDAALGGDVRGAVTNALAAVTPGATLAESANEAVAAVRQRLATVERARQNPKLRAEGREAAGELSALAFTAGLTLGIPTNPGPGPTAGSVTNPIPARMARVIPAEFAGGARLGAPTATEVWVTAADDLAGITTSEGLAQRLTLVDRSGALIPGPRAVIEFDAVTEGLASPVFRDAPGFVGRGRTAGGAREFVLPNLSIDELQNVTVREVP